MRSSARDRRGAREQSLNSPPAQPMQARQVVEASHRDGTRALGWLN